MYIFRYFFQKGHFKVSSRKKGTSTKNFGGGGAWQIHCPPAPEGLSYVKWSPDTEISWIQTQYITKADFFDPWS